ncbi:MAG TPA: class I SAM-dependent methyltransferase [Dehalococcoidia bacterium]|nr:class I SAM-dependent methyltransferase [Dehalococcoidia bacterium]
MKQSSTAYGAAFLRAMENLLPEDKRFFEDPYSRKILPPVYRYFVIIMRPPKIWNFLMNMREKLTPGVVGGVLCRTRYIDDLLINAIKEGVGTVVNLGAGMDTRAFRIPGIENIQYFELDSPELLKVKSSNINKEIGELPSNVSLVPIDFNSQDLGEELKKAGYTLSLKTFFIWEGVTQYISKEAIDNTLKYFAQAPTGSRIVFTYVLKSFINGSYIPDGLNILYKTMLKKKNPFWFCGFDPAEMKEYLSKYSLSLIEDVGNEEYLERYIKPKSRDLTVMEIERTVLAEVK